MPKAVLSHKQFCAILFCYVIGSSLMYLPEGSYAGKDAWISTIISSLLGFMILAAWLRLARRHPGKSPIQIGIKVLGTVPGYILGLYLILIFFTVATLIMQNMINLSRLIVLRTTPVTVIRITFLAVALFACFKGVESIGRLCELVFLPLTFMVLILPVLELPQWSFDAFQPLLKIAWPHVLVGTLNASVFPFAESLMPMMLFPYISQDRESDRYYYLVLAAASVMLLMRTVLALMVFPASIIQLLVMPFFALFRQVSLSQFFDRSEGLFLGIFVFGLLIKLIITVYVIGLGLGQLFAVRRLQNIWLPLGLVLVTVSCTMYPNFRDFSYFAFMVFPVFAAPGELLYPFLLVAADAVRGRLQPRPVNKVNGDVEELR